MKKLTNSYQILTAMTLLVLLCSRPVTVYSSPQGFDSGINAPSLNEMVEYHSMIYGVGWDSLYRYDGTTFHGILYPLGVSGFHHHPWGGLVVFQDKLYMILFTESPTGDVYSATLYSYDGTSFAVIHEFITGSEGIISQYSSSMIVYRDKLYIPVSTTVFFVEPDSWLIIDGTGGKSLLSFPSGGMKTREGGMAVYNDNLYLVLSNYPANRLLEFNGTDFRTISHPIAGKTFTGTLIAHEGFLYVKEGPLSGTDATDLIRYDGATFGPAITNPGPGIEPTEDMLSYNGSLICEMTNSNQLYFLDETTSTYTPTPLPAGIMYPRLMVGFQCGFYVQAYQGENKLFYYKMFCLPLIPWRLYQCDHDCLFNFKVDLVGYHHEWQELGVNWLSDRAYAGVFQTHLYDRKGRLIWKREFRRPFQIAIPDFGGKDLSLALLNYKHKTNDELFYFDSDLIGNGITNIKTLVAS